MIGRSLCHFTITERLGAGGMGEVYRAHDQRLDRQVALKILPAEVSSNAERLARFRREARLLAALNHPNIVTVFSIDEADGVHFLTMELVEGQTLDRVVPRNGLPLDRFFSLSLQLIDAVAAAHDSGVVHRDLKPSNVMVTGSQVVKVLDFGLARPSDEAAAGESHESTAFLTSEHRVLGTPAYMAPEQVRGERASQQSDIFSLGILLYEMATGRSPFEGKSRIEVMSSILRDKPALATDLRSDLPPHLARIVRRCLEKKTGDRHQSARDLRFAVEELRDELSAGEALPSAHMIGAMPERRARHGLVAAAALAGALALGLWIWSSMSPDEPLEEALIATPVVTWPSEERAMRISPDGDWLSFLSDRDGSKGLWIQRTEGGEARAVVSGERTVLDHAWSPGGDEIAVLTRQGDRPRLEVVPAPLGGRSRLSLELSAGLSVVDWVGDLVFLEAPDGLWTLDLTTGEQAPVPLRDGEFEFRRHFDLSADGGTLVFSALRGGRENLWAQTLPDGELEPLTDDDAKATFPHCLGVDCDRVVYLSNRTAQTDVWVLERKSGASRQLRVPTRVEALHDASLDGAIIALQVIHEVADLWFYDRAADRHRPLTADSLSDYSPSAGAGSSLIAFQRSRPDTELAAPFLDARVLVAELRQGALADLRPIAERGYAPVLSPDGDRVAYLETSDDGALPYFTKLWVAEVESGRKRKVTDHFQMTGFNELPAAIEARNVLWAAPDALLYVEASESIVPEIRRSRLSDAQSLPETLTAGEPRSQILDVRQSAAGDLGFVYRTFDSPSWKLRVLGPATGISTLYARELPQGILRLLGPLDGGRWVLAETPALSGVGGRVEILDFRAGGPGREIAAIEGASIWTAVLDPDGPAVLLSAARGATSDIIRIDLDSGQSVRVTDNPLPGVVFCGIQPQGEGDLVYSRQQRNADLWLLRRGPSASSDHR